ncbi:TnsD family Tn7-like transposition protein [Salinibacter altiplanensis]|uniref:TnsD family Tn7-like transposition protein n=1 Tax=Salinibacter altiplanensis TaxID=1803181 RepID=UPI001E2F98BA|nr:TnsD family Tn7-like transposition protein [Salinibacter altiplanensis]
MSALFPDPFPDELLYSALARYQDMMGITGGRSVHRTFFEAKTGRAVFDLPGRIDALLSSLPAGHQYTPKRILYEHTQLPYYVPFLPPERADRVERAMRMEEGSTIHGRLGLRSSRVSLAQPYRFCPDCAEEDRNSHGVSYWHRVHQLPGIWVCTTHGTILREYRPRSSFPPYDFISLGRLRRLDLQTQPAIRAEENSQGLKRLADDTSCLLANRVRPTGLPSIHKRYRYHLHLNGWMQTATRIRMSDARRAFYAHFGTSLLEKLGCSPPQDKDGWFERLLRKPRTASHPLHHLLVLQFLGASVLDFFGQRAPRLKSRPTAAAKEQNQRSNSRKPSTDRKTRDSSWEKRLAHLVQHTDRSLRSIAEALTVDPRTVQRHARRLGVWRKEWTTWDKVAPATKQADATVERREKYRSQWLSLQKRNPDEGITVLPKRAPAAYAFLYRVDRTWLDAHRPSPPIARVQPSRVNWPSRDLEFRNRAVEVVETLRQSPGRPVWIRRSTVLRRMGRTSEFFSNRDHLPKTQAFLNEVSETRVEFARKKIDWATLDFIALKKRPQTWKFVRYASLRPDLAAQLSEEIAEALSKIRGATPELDEEVWGS